MVGKEQIVAVYLSGRSVPDTAVELNTSEKRVRKYVLEAGVMRPAKRRGQAAGKQEGQSPRGRLVASAS